MVKKDRTAIFITPGASKVGGNIFILEFLKWLKRNSSIPFLTIYGNEGELEQEFRALGEAFRFDEIGAESLIRKGIEKISREFQLRKLYFQIAWLRRRLAGTDIGLIYSNAVTNYRILSALPVRDVPIISHCHELESVIYRTGIEGFRKTCEMTSHFVAPAKAVKQNLIQNHNIVPDRISIVNEFIPITVFSPDDLEQKRQQVFAELNIPENAFVVGASGTLYWRKAPELFILVADLVIKHKVNVPIYFLWVGGGKKDDFHYFELNYDLEKLTLTDRVHFLEYNPDYFAALDLFMMISREDPFPLVCIDAAARGKPIICFENAGGTPEFVEDDCGVIVPYLDIRAMADRIVELSGNPDLLSKMSIAAAAKARARHDILETAPKILEIIENFIRR